MLAALLSALLLLTQASPQVDVALDPGHSRADIGSSGSGLREYQLTLDLAQRVRSRLEAAQLSVRLTRQDDLPLTAYMNPLATDQIQAEQVARIAAAGSARVYVSLHFNGGPTNLRGTETYFNPDRAVDATSSDAALASALQRHVVAALADEVGYAFQVEMNYRCYLHGFRVAEVPIVFVDRRVGKRKMGSHIVTEAMLVVLRLRLQTLLGTRPKGWTMPAESRWPRS